MEQNDQIKLTGCGQITLWKFPKSISHCPVKNCVSFFESRSDAIAHYKTKHATKSILCSDCKKPLLIRDMSDLNWHYYRQHPNVKNPFDSERIHARSKKQLELASQLEDVRTIWRKKISI